MDDDEEDLLGQGEEEEVKVKQKKKVERPPWRLNMPYWWRKYQLPTEIKDHHASVPVKATGKYPVRVLLNDGIRAGDSQATQKALNAGADVKHVNEFSGEAPVHAAVIHGRANVVQTLWDNGADVDVTMDNRVGDTALHLAARRNDDASIKSLIKVEASADLLNKQGETALHVAAAGGHYEACRELLAGGADPSIENTDGRTAKELAELAHFPQLAAYLLNFD